MSTTYLRKPILTTFLVAAGASTVCYTGYNLNKKSFLQTAHAESLPSDSKAALAKVPWKGFTELTLESSEIVNHNVKRLTFSLPTTTSITGLSPVTSLLTQHTPEGSFIPVFRPYTPVSSPSDPGTVTFMVKHYPGGKGSTKMHTMVPGDKLKFKPLEEFKYEPNAHKSILMIAGGSGITPIYQLTNAILSNPEDKTSISLIYANNTEEDILLKSEFEALESKYPGRFKKVFTVKTPSSSSSSSGSDEIKTGYITKPLITSIWSASKEPGQKVLVSGPPAMTESIAGAKGMWGWTQGSIGGVLAELGYGKEDVHKF